MILVTGAAGKTGQSIIRALAERGEVVRAFVRRSEHERLVLELGADQVIVGDLGNRSEVQRAVTGVQAIYHICPNVNPHEIDYANLLIESALSAHVARFGYHSVLHPQTEQMGHHWRKMRVEEALFRSGLPFTIIQPCAYAQNLFAQRESILSRGVIEVPYSIEAKLSWVDLEDVAAAVATILCEPGHNDAIYELAGTSALSHVQIAAMFQALLDKPVRAVRVEVATWAARARRSGLGEHQIETLQSMFAYYDRYGFRGNSKVLTWLLGRRPTRLEDVVKRLMQTE